jgi:hypothetical protein
MTECTHGLNDEQIIEYLTGTEDAHEAAKLFTELTFTNAGIPTLRDNLIRFLIDSHLVSDYIIKKGGNKALTYWFERENRKGKKVLSKDEPRNLYGFLSNKFFTRRDIVKLVDIKNEVFMKIKVLDLYECDIIDTDRMAVLFNAELVIREETDRVEEILYLNGLVPEKKHNIYLIEKERKFTERRNAVIHELVDNKDIDSRIPYYIQEYGISIINDSLELIHLKFDVIQSTPNEAFHVVNRLVSLWSYLPGTPYSTERLINLLTFILKQIALNRYYMFNPNDLNNSFRKQLRLIINHIDEIKYLIQPDDIVVKLLYQSLQKLTSYRVGFHNREMENIYDQIKNDMFPEELMFNEHGYPNPIGGFIRKVSGADLSFWSENMFNTILSLAKYFTSPPAVGGDPIFHSHDFYMDFAPLEKMYDDMATHDTFEYYQLLTKLLNTFLTVELIDTVKDLKELYGNALRISKKVSNSITTRKDMVKELVGIIEHKNYILKPTEIEDDLTSVNNEIAYIQREIARSKMYA